VQRAPFDLANMDARGRSRGNLIDGGRWLVLAPLSPVGIGLALARWPVFFRLLLFETRIFGRDANGGIDARTRAFGIRVIPLVAQKLREAA
jgi:hypothetical protein